MRLSATRAFELWAPTFEAGTNPLIALDDRVLRPLIGRVTSTSLVEIGCGTGRRLAALAEHAARVVGIDVCSGMLAIAGKKRVLSGRLVRADAGSLPLPDECFDVVLSSLSLGYFPDLKRAIHEMARITKPGGKIIVSDMHPAALESGWSRSFRHGSTVIDIEHFAPSIENIEKAALQCGLKVRYQSDHYFGEPEFGIFIRSGKEQQFRDANQVPALWVGVWTR